MFGIHAHGIDHPVHTDTAGEPLERLDGVFAIEVDRLRALALRHAQTIVMAVDGEHPASAQQLGAGNGELAHRAAPEHRHGVAAAHLGHLGAEVAGGEDVREQNRLIVADLRWQFDQPDVGERDTGLSACRPWNGPVVCGPP